MLENFQQVKKLGQGHYGSVFLVREINTSNLFALKILNKPCSIEKDLLKTLQHPNILPILNCFQDAHNQSLLLEYAEGGDLRAYINNQFELEQRLIVSLLAQIVLALYYLHVENSIIHRDIKLQNVLLASNGLVKLCDFGISRRLGSDEDFVFSEVGTPVTLSPERISQSKYDYKSDIWGVGCVMYELMSRVKPFSPKSADPPSILSLYQSIVHEKPDPLPPRYSEWLRGLVSSMLEKSPEKRPSTLQILQNKEIRRQLLRLRDKYPEYKQCTYIQIMLENPKTVKYVQWEEKEFTVPLVIAESLKTTRSKMAPITLGLSQRMPPKQEATVEDKFYTLSLPYFIESAKRRKEKST